ncbi:hypothetical protein V6Z12_D10G106800 [Gossypium hirsutum]
MAQTHLFLGRLALHLGTLNLVLVIMSIRILQHCEMLSRIQKHLLQIL